MGNYHASDLSRRAFVQRALAIGAGAAALPASGCREETGTVRSSRTAGGVTLESDRFAATWSVAEGRFRVMEVVDRPSGRSLPLGSAPFALALSGSEVIQADELQVVGEPVVGTLGGLEDAPRLSERLPGRVLTVHLEDPRRRFRVTWRGIMRAGSRYARQEIELESGGENVPIREIRMVDIALLGARVHGEVRGSPVVSGPWYTGFESPLAEARVDAQRVVGALARELPLRPGTVPAFSSVIGAVTEGQLRRDFLLYLERERAHPYRPFLHYNSWYDLGYFTMFDEAQALAVIEAYGTELVRNRGVRLDSFLFDDGWDDRQTLWAFHDGFPSGFAPLRDAAARYGAAPGVWMSPWGGYGDPRRQRVEAGRAEGFETIDDRFALSGPMYFGRFRDTCLRMIREYGVNQFKFDGTGNADVVIPGSEFDSDFDAMLRLIADLRAERPDLYVNLTTGTYPSPFFLRHADSIWRGGNDHEFAGVGSQRQRWITYRDGDTYRGIVGRGPLFPLNALMLHGLIYATHARDLNTDPEDDFRSEIRSYFGTGTQLQEMYVTPGLLTEENWDDLAAAANWARRNALTLGDTHWVGGDPRDLDVYGWAAWNAGRATLVLRNPSDAPQEVVLDAEDVFELPHRAPGRYSLRRPWVEDQYRPPVEMEAGRPERFRLAPFEVLTLSSG